MPDRVEKHIQVETYSGHKADERPVRITIDGLPHDVAEVEDRWYSSAVGEWRALRPPAD